MTRASRPFPVSVVLFVMVADTAACSGSGDGGKEVMEPPAAPVVVATVPAPGEQAADPFADVSATFDAALDPATVTPAAFTVAAGAAVLVAEPVLDATSRTVRLAPPLLPGRAYQATVSTAVRSAEGVALSAPYDWTFTTRAWQVAEIGAKRDYRNFAFVGDAAGTLHRLIPRTDGANMTLYYGSCASGCDAAAGWTEVALFSSGVVHGHSILVEGSGRRHVFFQDGSSARLYYGTCATACDALASWQLVNLATGTVLDGLDAAPVVREPDGSLLVATVSYTGSDYGIVLVSCASACTDPGNWKQALLAPAGRAPALAIDPDGTHHLLFRRPGDQDIVYGVCPANCLSPSAWQMTPIHAAGTFTDIALLRTSSGMYAAFNAGPWLTLLSCASGCSAAASWDALVVDDGTLGNDRAISLAGDANGRLHLFYSNANTAEMKYATCASACDAAAGWQSGVVLTGISLRQVHVVLGATNAPIVMADDATADRLVLVR